MKLIKIVVLIILLASASAQADVNSDLVYQGLSNKGNNLVLDTLQQLKSNPDAEFTVKNGWTIVSLKNAYSMWTFAPENHPAYPSFAKRTPVKRDDGIYLETKITCGASKEVCDSFVKDFIAINNKIKEQMKSQ